MPRLIALGLLLAFLSLIGCAPTHATLDPEPPTDSAGEQHLPEDDGSVYGTWYAVEIRGDAQATRDLREDILERTLIIRHRGQVILTGVDRRVNNDPITYAGDLIGNQVYLRGLSGSATVRREGPHLTLTTPGGETTVFLPYGASQ